MAESEKLEIAPDPLSWGKLPKAKCAWVREIAGQPDTAEVIEDLDKFILGMALFCIVGDDRNSLQEISVGTPEGAERSRQELLARLDWEVGLPELPEDIKERIEGARMAVAEANWTNPDSLQKSRKAWFSMSDWVKQQKLERPELQAAEDYYRIAWETLQKQWRESLKKKQSGEGH